MPKANIARLRSAMPAPNPPADCGSVRSARIAAAIVATAVAASGGIVTPDLASHAGTLSESVRNGSRNWSSTTELTNPFGSQTRNGTVRIAEMAIACATNAPRRVLSESGSSGASTRATGRYCLIAIVRPSGTGLADLLHNAAIVSASRKMANGSVQPCSI